MENVFLKPALDAAGNAMVVPDPDGGLPLKAEGEWKPLTMYWARRIRDSDAIQSEPPKAAAETPIPAPPKAAAASPPPVKF